MQEHEVAQPKVKARDRDAPLLSARPTYDIHMQSTNRITYRAVTPGVVMHISTSASVFATDILYLTPP
jgi:hypothetical protein